MVIKRDLVSPQYLLKDEISVTIIEVKCPAHFIVKESPSLSTSSEAKKFLEAEEAMQQYYHSIEPSFFQLPLKDSIIVVLNNRKFYRAQVRSILNVSDGHLIKAYLLDYGRECSVPRQCLFEIHQDFLVHPFQAIDFKLLEIEPISLVSSLDLTLDYGPVSTWDPSAISFVEHMNKGMNCAHIKVERVRKDCLYGSLYMTFDNNEVKCLNEELVLKKFAWRNPKCSNDMTKIDAILPKVEQHHVARRHPGTCSTEEPDSPISSPSKCAATSPVSNQKNEPNETMKRLQRLKMLYRKSSKGPDTSLASPCNSSVSISNTSSSASNASMSFSNTSSPSNASSHENASSVHKMTSPFAVSPDVSQNGTLDSKKGKDVKVQENTVPKESPNNAESTGMNQLQRLLKYRRMKNSSPPQIPQSSNTPLVVSRTLSEMTCSSSPLLSPENNSRKMEEALKAISPITYNKSPIISPQKLDSILSSPRRKTNNSSEIGTIDVTPVYRLESKFVQGFPEVSSDKLSTLNEKSQLVSPPKPSTVKFEGIKNILYQKRNPIQSAAHTQDPTSEIFKDCLNSCLESDNSTTELLTGLGSMGSVPESEDGLIEKFADVEDMGDLLQCVLDPSNVAECNSPSSSPNNSRKSSFNDGSAETQPSNNIDFSDKSLWEKQKVPALCLGEGASKPYLSTNDASFPSTLQKTLQRLNFCGPSSIQSVVWPAVSRSRCLAAVGPPHSGKTVAYLLPLVANFMTEDTYAGLPNTTGPLAIILCSSWKKVQAVYDLFKLFLSGVNVKVLTFFADGRSKKNKVGALLNGCDILISVPYCLLQFFRDNLVCVKRCCHFILDDGNSLLSYNMKELKEIMLHFGKRVELRSSVRITLQVLICAERWTKGVASFVEKFMNSPLLLFTSFLESAVFSQVPIFAHVCDETDKNSKLLKILEDARKTIICTRNSSKAFEIHNFLRCESIRSFLVSEEMEHYISNGVIQDWKSVQSSADACCLVVTDTAFTHMNISNANYLIHYDLPEISRLQFGNRFSCIAEHFTKLKSTTDCACHMLISGDCSNQAPSILKLIKRSGVQVSQELKDLAVMRSNMKADNSPLCHYMKAFGKCKLPFCQKRHHLDAIIDQPNIVPSSGDFQALVTHVCDATHFYVRILKHIAPDVDQWSSMSGNYAKIGFQLKKFYSLESNCQKVEHPVIGETYVLQEDNQLFYRVKVLDMLPSTETKQQKIKLLYRDEGWVQIHEHFQLFSYIDSDLFPPPLAVEVYVCGVNTPDTSPDWNPQANRFISDLIKGKEIHGKIVLCLGETLWLQVTLREKLMFSNDYLNIMTLDKSLKEAEFALDNKNHLPLLIEACENKISLPKPTKPTTRTKTTMYEPLQVCHAFLDLNAFEDVYVSSVVSPQQFYVQRAKFVDCLDELLDKIEAKVKAKALQKCSTLLKGMHCIAPFYEDNRYYRAVVTDVLTDSNSVQLFFVDFGDTSCASWDSIFVLPSEFSLLPFQAIECELDGICAAHGGWTDKAGDTLYNLTRDDANDMKILQLQAYKKSLCYDGGNHYVVDIWSCDKSISEQLLEAGLVCSAEKSTPVDVPFEAWNKKVIFEDAPEGYIKSSDEDLDEEDKDIHASFCLALAKMVNGTYSGSPTKRAFSATTDNLPENENEQSISEDSGFPTLEAIRETEHNAHVNESAQSVSKKKKMKVMEIAPTASYSPFLALQNLLKFRKKENEPKRSKPYITWWDTEEHINVFINLRDIQIYVLDVHDNRFVFNTSLRGVDYYTNEEFYSKVHSEKPVINNGVSGLSIILKKQETMRWPRFTKEAIKFSHIKYDWDHIDDSDSEATTEEKIMTIPETELPNENETVNQESSDEDEDNSDDDTYIHSWKKLAEFKDPFDPLD